MSNDGNRLRTEQQQAAQRNAVKEQKFDTPMIPEAVYAGLPKILTQACNLFGGGTRERDMFLTASLSLLGGVLRNYHTYYNNKKVHFNIFSMIVAPPASGKGVITHALSYVEDIERNLREDFARKLAEYQDKIRKSKDQGDKGVPEHINRPRRKRLIIPANSSSAAFISSLYDSDATGVIFETEADTLAQVLKQDWGNYSDLLRKAYHHEPISYSRKQDGNEIFIDEPKLSVLLSGTFNQVGGLGLDNPANGLQSRFFFYLFESIPTFNLSVAKSKDLIETLGSVGSETSFLHNQLSGSEESIEFVVSAAQWAFFERHFQDKMDKVVRTYNVHAAAIVTRAALGAIRLAGILSMLRELETHILVRSKIPCSWQTLRQSVLLVDTYIEHTLVIFHYSKMSQQDPELRKYMDFYQKLPKGEFTRKDILSIAAEVGFSDSSLDRRLRKLKISGRLQSHKFGVYFKK